MIPKLGEIVKLADYSTCRAWHRYANCIARVISINTDHRSPMAWEGCWNVRVFVDGREQDAVYYGIEMLPLPKSDSPKLEATVVESRDSVPASGVRI